MEVLHYITGDGRDPFHEWFRELRDPRGKVAIFRRIDRLAAGDFGNHRFCQGGVWELKLDVGPGYRVYYGQAKKTVVILLCAGSKRTQEKDIYRAVLYWRDYQERTV